MSFKQVKLIARIKPNSRHRQGVVKNPDGMYTIYTKAPAVENRANQEAIALVAQYMRVSKTHVAIIRGVTSKYKVFTISQAMRD